MKKFLKKHKKGLAIVGGTAIIGLGAYEIYEKKRDHEIKERLNSMKTDFDPDKRVERKVCDLEELDKEFFEHFDPDKRVESL